MLMPDCQLWAPVSCWLPGFLSPACISGGDWVVRTYCTLLPEHTCDDAWQHMCLLQVPCGCKAVRAGLPFLELLLPNGQRGDPALAGMSVLGWLGQ